MSLSKRSSVFVFGLLLGVICSPEAKARAEEALAASSLSELAASVAPASPTMISSATAYAALPDDPGVSVEQQAPAGSGTAPAPAAGAAPAEDPLAHGRQTKRILYVIPNFRAVSADQHLPPQTVKEKFKTAMLDSVDYSAFIFVGAQAGVAQATKSYPEFGQGAAGYGRYYWHTLADEINENTFVEFIVPSLLHQDTRYYTLGKGGIPKRAAYAFTRVLITRQDSGKKAFNYSEIVGAAAFSGVANLYYPSQERTFTKTYQRYITNLCIDGGVFVFKEVWPDINNSLFHQKD